MTTFTVALNTRVVWCAPSFHPFNLKDLQSLLIWNCFVKTEVSYNTNGRSTLQGSGSALMILSTIELKLSTHKEGNASRVTRAETMSITASGPQSMVFSAMLPQSSGHNTLIRKSL